MELKIIGNINIVKGFADLAVKFLAPKEVIPEFVFASVNTLSAVAHA